MAAPLGYHYHHVGTPLDMRPILPSLANWSFFELLLPPLAILLSLAIHLILNTPDRTAGRAHVYRAKTAHARFLPTVARHVFSYPVVYFGADLDALEAGHLDLPARLFAWLPPTRWTVTALRPRAYLDPSASAPSIKATLLEHLAQHSVPASDAARIYTVTMPGYLGREGINPLTVHFCYTAELAKWTTVVLEVHNTFGERHLYILRLGVDEDDHVAHGYEHQWTFPRSFHVSPFNDRSGFYRVSVIDPLASRSQKEDTLCERPRLDVRIVTLTPERTKKLYASLAGSGDPLTPRFLVFTLLQQPLALLLTTPRILWQAAKLHYSKRLDVFPRPEPFVALPSEVTLLQHNPVETGGKPGNVGWQPPGSTEAFARRRVIRFLERRLHHLSNVRVVLVPADASQPTNSLQSSSSVSTEETMPVQLLTIHYLTPLFFTDLLVSPTAALALELGSHLERRWFPSDDSLFLQVFSAPSPSRPRAEPSVWTRLARTIRQRQVEWSSSFLGDERDYKGGLNLFESKGSQSGYNPLDLDLDLDLEGGSGSGMDAAAMAYHVATHALFTRMVYWVFVATRARFVPGTEAWAEWARLLQRRADRLHEGATKRCRDAGAKIIHGSVIRS